MEFIDLHAQRERIKARLDSIIKKVISEGQYIMGPEVRELEKRLASYVGVKHAIGCASGTDALLMALMAFGVGAGDAVFTTPFTFISTAEVISILGAVPVFVDIDPKTYNIDPGQLEKAVVAVKTKDSNIHPLPRYRGSSDLAPKAVIPVDLYGLMADYNAIESVAEKHGLKVIEDAAQAFGAEMKGRKACSLSDISCTSFFPAKPLGCYGDGGMCFTDDDHLAGILQSLRVHGKGSHKYDNVRIGINGRLDTLQAGILQAKFDIFPDEVEKRQTVAKRYTDMISSETSYVVPHIPDGYKSAWAQYTILAKNEQHRAESQKTLKDKGIPTAIYYPTPLHLQTAIAPLGYEKGDFPVSENCAGRTFSLPMHPYLTVEQQMNVVRVLSGR